MVAGHSQEPQAQAGQPRGYELLASTFKRRTGIDLAAYKERQMIRRLTSYLKRVDAPDFAALALRIARDDEALAHLKDYITINVSEFFRNPDRYAVLESDILPELIRKFGALRVWSAGCSIGAEPYSLAILLEELDPQGAHRVLGTDVDTGALEEARAGVFAADKLREVSPERLERHFTQTGVGLWQVSQRVRDRVRFRVHDLLRDPYPVGQHLILCRNVVIYFVDEAKEEVFHKLAGALVEGGYLMVGSTESIFRPERYGLQSAGSFIYRKVGGGAAGVGKFTSLPKGDAASADAGGRGSFGAFRAKV
ncbi:MAG: chemotaxis protein CheR [Firmicutes bacterium]|nr:chemotaxis protein CheR [Bacillota bacterium]